MLLLDEYAEFSIPSFESGIPCAGPGWAGPAGCVSLPLAMVLVCCLSLTGGTGGTVPSRAEIPGAQVINFQQIRAEGGSASGQMCLQASLVLGAGKELPSRVPGNGGF